MPSRIGAFSGRLGRGCFPHSSSSSSTTSPPSARSSSINSSRLTTIDRAQTEFARTSDDRATRRGVGGVLNDPLARFQPNEIMQHSPGRQRIDLQHRGLFRSNFLRHGHQFRPPSRPRLRATCRRLCGRMTCVPTVSSRTAAPIFSTTPAPSNPGVAGSGGRIGYFPFDLVQVGGIDRRGSTRTSASSAPISGIDCSSKRKTSSGFPCA